MSIEPLSLVVARAAGEALAKVASRPKGTSLVIDAIVVSSAASHGGVVYTSDVADLERLESAR